MHHFVQLIFVHVLHPVSHDDAGDAVADHVGKRSGFTHESVHPENQCQTGHRHVPHGRQRRREHNKARPRHARRTLTRQKQHSQKRHLLHDRHLHIAGLSNEDGGHREINRRAVQVKGISRRDHEPHDGLTDACVFHLRHHAREHGFRRRRPKDNQKLFLDIADVAEDRKPVPTADAAQHPEHKEKTREIERPHQFRQGKQRPDAVLTDRKSHCAERTYGRHAHDHAHDLEKDVRTLFNHVENQRTAAAELMKRKPEKKREEQNLQNFTVRKRPHDGMRNDVHQELRRSLHLARPRVSRHRTAVQGRRIHVHADTGLADVHHDKTDDERDRRHDFKIKQRKPPRFPHLLHVLHTSNTGDDRAEDDGGDDHFDEADEAVAERFHLGTDVGEEVPQEDAENDGADHLEIKNLVNRGTLFAHDAHYLSGPLSRPDNCSVPLMFQSGVY